MKKIFKSLFIIILSIFLIGMITGFIDYYRMTNYELPIFNISSYDSEKKIQKFQGMIYSASRKVRASYSENLSDSKKIEFKLLVFDLYIPVFSKNEENDYKFIIKNDDECNIDLYYADLDKKVYTYCLKNIMLNNKEFLTYLEKDKNIIDNIENSISYTGLYNNSIMMFKNDNIKIYHCSNNIIYIGDSNLDFKDDFCIDKDDDLKFIFEIKEEIQGIDLKDEEEVFYEDEDYEYIFDKVKSDYVYIVTPEVRGRASKKIKIKDVLNNKLLSIDELEKKGLSFTKKEKNKE